MQFKYFDDPLHFAYLSKEPKKCSICATMAQAFDAGFRGENEIEAICYSCLSSLRLKPLKIEANEPDILTLGKNNKDTSFCKQATDVIMYGTPPLPTWQDMSWPVIDDDYGVFMKIASKKDILPLCDGISPETFIEKFTRDERLQYAESSELWADLPDKRFTDLETANYDISLYLFRSANNSKNYALFWDAS